MGARILNVLIGTWLFLSAFMWPHPGMQRAATIACGVLIALTALASIYTPRARYLTALVAFILFVTSIASARIADRTVWHNTVAAVIAFFAALADRGQRRERDDQDKLARPLGAH